MRPSALFLSPEAPYPATGGGSLRSAALLEYLASRYAVDVVVFREPGAPDPRPALPAGVARCIGVIDLPYHSRSLIARAARNTARYLAHQPPLNDRFAGFTAPLAELLSGRQYDLAVIEHFWCAPYCDQLQQHAARVVLDLHNIESVFYGRSAQVEPWPASIALRSFERTSRALERHWLPRFSLALVTSAADAEFVREICPEVNTHVYPNTIPFTAQPDVPEEHALVFSGNFDYRPNISAVRFFRSRIWPLLRDRWPGLVWRLAGKNPRGIVHLVAGDPRIEVTGPIGSAIETLAAARVVVVPLLAGSGTRLKLLEAWAAGRAVVSTRLGAEGLPVCDGQELMLADSPEAFAEAVSRLLAAPGTRVAMVVAPTGELAVKHSGRVLAGTTMTPASDPATGQFTILDQTMFPLNVRVRGVPDMAGLDGTLWVELTGPDDQQLFRGSLADFRDWTEDPVLLEPGVWSTFGLHAWIPGDVGPGYAGRMVQVDLGFRVSKAASP
jgi:glycosyltransferase involved in cell wall biosynthesis